MMDDDDAIFIPSDDDDTEFSRALDLSPSPSISARRSESPRRKRARYGVDQGPSADEMKQQVEEETDVPAQTSGVMHDGTYYMEDGSCVLLVENTLFNVHRTILSKDSSSFSTMFTLPQGGQQAEGVSDEKPIVLVGDTAAEFRHFLWALYALPHELSIVHSPRAPLPTLIDIARVSNKYSFKSLETWALDAVQEYVNRKPSPVIGSIPTPTTPSTPLTVTAENTVQLTSLVRLAVMCEHPRLLGTMIALLRQLMGLSPQYAYLAMTLADELDLRTLRGAAYLEVMQKAVVVRRPHANGQEGVIDAEGRLVVSPTQQLRLLSGYYRLTGAWERMRAAPPKFDHTASCAATWHEHGCTQSWLEFWKEKSKCDSVLTLGLADVLGRLRAMAKEFDRWGSATYMHHECRLAARRSIQEKIKGIEEALPDYFSEEGE